MTFISLPVMAYTETYEEGFEVSLSTDKVLSILTDFENTCMKNCKYYAPDIKEIKRLAINAETNQQHYYIWTYVSSVMDSQYFSEIRIENQSGHIKVVQRQVDSATAERLAKETGLSNKPLLQSMQIETMINRHEQLEKVSIKQVSTVAYGFFLKTFRKKIYNSLVDNSASFRENLIASSQ